MKDLQISKEGCESSISSQALSEGRAKALRRPLRMFLRNKPFTSYHHQIKTAFIQRTLGEIRTEKKIPEIRFQGSFIVEIERKEDIFEAKMQVKSIKRSHSRQDL